MTAPVLRYDGGDERMDRTSIPVDAAQEIKPGWFVNLESSECVPHNAEAEDQYFAGIALTGHSPNVDHRTEISITETCVVEVDVASASYVRGEKLKISGTASGDSIILITDAGSNTLCWAAETKATTTRLKVRIDVWRLSVLRGAVS